MSNARTRVEELLGEGKSQNEIASILGITKSCVHWHASERNREYARLKRKDTRRRLVSDIKKISGGCCAICGYNKCLDALDFHHIEPSKKTRIKKSGGGVLGVIGMIRSISYKKAVEESKKCILVCANCHREQHSILIGD